MILVMLSDCCTPFRNSMKFNLSLLIFIFIACCNPKGSSSTTESDSTANNSIEFVNKDDSEDNSQKMEKPNDDDSQIKYIQNEFGFTDSIRLISFYEETIDEYDLYEYVFQLPSSHSKYHKRFEKFVTFNQKSLEYVSHYGRPSTWPKTSKTIQNEIQNSHSLILSEWIELKYYDGELTLSEDNPYYYFLTDTLFFDFTYMDGPYLYNYTKIENSSKDHLKLTLKGIDGEEGGKMNFYFITKDLALIDYEDRFSDNISRCTLMLRKSKLFDYPLIAIESTDLPEGVNLKNVNCDSIKSLHRFN